MITSVLRLFKSIPMGNEGRYSNRDLLKYGLVLDKDVTINNNVFDEIVSMYGIDSVKVNNTLHKSLSYVKNASDEELIYDQLLHYFSTYGREALGLEAKVIVPNEILNLPEDEDSLVINVIHVLTIEEIVNKVQSLLSSNIAMSKTTLEDIVKLVDTYNVKFYIDNVKNKELSVRLCERFNLVPKNPSAFLRYVVYKLTGNSLLINRSNSMKRQLRMFAESVCRYNSSMDVLHSMFTTYTNLYGTTLLEETFYRYKYIWVALKNEHTATFINKLRKKADKANRQRNGLKVLDRLTSDNNISAKEIRDELKNVSVYKKIALLNAFNYRNINPKSFVYRIRNGKSYIKEVETCNKPKSSYYNIILSSIINDLKGKFENKKFYIPNNVNYAVPTSEKKFVGAIPYGSYIDIGKTAIVGCYWENLNGERVDLDLHASAVGGRSIGWDSRYRSDNGDILFTGDMTDATNGATEAIYVTEEWNDFCSMDVCFYNHSTVNECFPFKYKLIVDGGSHDRVNSDYILSKKSIMTMINLEMETPTQTVGFLTNVEDNVKRLYFFNLGADGITTSNDSLKELQLDYANNVVKSQLTLRDLIELCDGEIVEEMDEDVIDLSINNLTKETFIDFLTVEK